MANARLGRELVIETPDEVGMLGKISAAISKSGVNVISICAYGMEGKAHFMLLTSDNTKTAEVLSPLNFSVQEHDVVMIDLEDKIGALEEMSKKLAALGINLKYVYGTTSLGGGGCFLVLSADNNDEVIRALNK